MNGQSNPGNGKGFWCFGLNAKRSIRQPKSVRAGMFIDSQSTNQPSSVRSGTFGWRGSDYPNGISSCSPAPKAFGAGLTTTNIKTPTGFHQLDKAAGDATPLGFSNGTFRKPRRLFTRCGRGPSALRERLGLYSAANDSPDRAGGWQRHRSHRLGSPKSDEGRWRRESPLGLACL